MRKRPILNYHGGKWMLKNWIIENLPEHDYYAEPFGGGASILLAKKPSKFEIYNDIDKDIYNFFWQVKHNHKHIIEQLKLTPYHKEVYNSARSILNPSDIDRAVNVIVKSFMGIGDSINNKTGFRRSISCNTSPAKSFKTYEEIIPFFADRLRDVIIDNVDFKDFIKKYDRENMLFYVDPPYIHSTRTRDTSYRHELSDYKHRELVGILNELRGKYVLSGYDNEIYDNLENVKKIYKETSTQKTTRIECLWIKK